MKNEIDFRSRVHSIQWRIGNSEHLDIHNGEHQLGLLHSILMFDMFGFKCILGLEVCCVQTTLNYQDVADIKCCAPMLAAHAQGHCHRPQYDLYTQVYPKVQNYMPLLPRDRQLLYIVI
jgi:hypothetical protein